MPDKVAAAGARRPWVRRVSAAVGHGHSDRYRTHRTNHPDRRHRPRGTLTCVEVTKTVSRGAVTGSFSVDRRRWSSSEALGYGAHYAIGTATLNPAGTSGSATAAITSITPAAQACANLIPARRIRRYP